MNIITDIKTTSQWEEFPIYDTLVKSLVKSVKSSVPPACRVSTGLDQPCGDADSGESGRAETGDETRATWLINMLFIHILNPYSIHI